MSQQDTAVGAKMMFIGLDITVLFREGHRAACGEGFMLSDGKVIHIFSGTEVKIAGKTILTGGVAWQIKMIDVSRISFKEDGKTRIFDPETGKVISAP